MRYALVVLCLLTGWIAPATAQVSVGIETPGFSIGINQPVYPQLVQVPGYPVYYAPQADYNYFFYDGYYWVYQGDAWYASTWYNGPWAVVEPQFVPYFLLRVPVRYYRRPPAYFVGWRGDAPPHWGEHWGRHWEDERRGWDTWDRHAVPAPAPLPVYQRQYSGARYPQATQQQVLQTQNYRYRPRETVAPQLANAQRTPAVTTAPATPAAGAAPREPQHGQSPSRQAAEQPPRAPLPPPTAATGNYPPQARYAAPRNSTATTQRPAEVPMAQERHPTSAPQSAQRGSTAVASHPVPQPQAAQHPVPPSQVAQHPVSPPQVAQRPAPQPQAAPHPVPQPQAAQHPVPPPQVAQRPAPQPQAVQRPAPQPQAAQQPQQVARHEEGKRAPERNDPQGGEHNK